MWDLNWVWILQISKKDLDFAQFSVGYPIFIISISFDNPFQSSVGGIGTALDVKATSSLYSGSDEGTVIPVFKKVNYGPQVFRPLDFFLVRRYVEDASSLITFQQYPYGNPPVSQSVSGFISPEYPTAQLKTNPDDILSDLIDKKLIE